MTHHLQTHRRIDGEKLVNATEVWETAAGQRLCLINGRWVRRAETA